MNLNINEDRAKNNVNNTSNLKDNKNTFYITTAIDYATGTPHIGHAYEKIATDVIARCKRLEGKDVFFLTGTDEHGQKVFEKAQENNKQVQEFVDEQTQKFLELTKILNLSNDFFIRTTHTHHKEFVQKMLQKAYDNGDIYLDEYDGLYCVGCEKYYGRDELIEIDGTSEICPIHKTQCRSVKQENYFFKLSKYENFLLELYENHPEFISPKHRREEIINRVKGGLRDLSISRPKETLTWGIEFPFDNSHVAYVWFDALFNYLSATNSNYKELSNFKNHWPCDIHIIGADISWFHMVYWPAFLKSCGFELPNIVHAHGMILDKDGHKMSKSLGNVVNPLDEIKEYGLDEFRYYIMSLGNFGDDCRYSHEEFEQTIINDLNNDLGNLVSRVYTMVQKYVGGTLKILDENTQLGLEEVDSKLLNSLNIKEEFVSLIDSFEIHKSMQLVWSKIRDLNAYINQTEPFKVEDEKRREVIMQVLVNSLYNLTSFISIVMPQKSQILAKQLGFGVKENLEFSYLDTEIKLGEKVQLFEHTLKTNTSTAKNEFSKVSTEETKKTSPLTILDENRVKIKAVLFDFDGVLVDNYKTVYEANNLAYNLTEERFKDLFDGNPLTGFKEAFEESKVRDFYKNLDEATKEMRIEKKVKKEILELKNKYQLFCVTSNIKKNIELVLENSELDETFFNEILCGDFNACKEQKINHILEQYNLQKDEVVFVTDTLGDLKEANRAGVKSIAVDFGFHEQERLEKGAPYKIVSSFKQIRRIVDALEKQTISNITIQLSDKLDSKTLSARLHTLHPTQKNTKLAVFVHGFCATKFGCKSEEFKWQFIGEGYDFLSFDLLGCGDNEAYPISINSQLKQVEELLEIATTQLGYTDVVLIGHSMGGYNVLSQNHNAISKKIAIAPLCFSRTKEEVTRHTLSRGVREENLKKIKAVFFDFDGVLVDTFTISYETMKLFYPDLTQDEYKEWFAGQIAKSWESRFSSMEDKIKFDDLYTQRNQDIELPQVVKDTCEKLKEKYDLFCITSNLKRNVDSILQRSGEEDLFKETLCYHFELSKSKKMQHLLDKYKLEKEEVVFITDTLGDLEEANEVGIKTICLDTGFNTKKTLQRGKPFSIISDFSFLEKQIESVERKMQQSEPIVFVDDEEKVHLLDSKLPTEFTQLYTKKLQKIANGGEFQTLVLQAQNDSIILKKDVDVFIEGCDTSKVQYSTIEGGTHSFKHNSQEENEFFYKEMGNFIKYGISEPPIAFTDLCLQVGTIISIENHPDAYALYVEQVDFGENGGVRQIVSGLKKYFTKEEMVGKQVLAVTNLQTAKLRGVDSQGMLLLAENKEGKLSFIVPEQNVENGSYVSTTINEEVKVANNSTIITVDEFFKHSLQAVEGGVVYLDLESNNKSVLQITYSNNSINIISEKNISGKIR